MADAKSRDILKAIGKELNTNPPGILAKTQRKKGPAASQKQRVAILINKARRAGVKVGPRK